MGVPPIKPANHPETPYTALHPKRSENGSRLTCGGRLARGPRGWGLQAAALDEKGISTVRSLRTALHRGAAAQVMR